MPHSQSRLGGRYRAADSGVSRLLLCFYCVLIEYGLLVFGFDSVSSIVIPGVIGNTRRALRHSALGFQPTP